MMNNHDDITARSCVDCRYRSPLFQLLSEEELRLVERNKVTVKFKKGETIKKQGTFMSHVLSLNCGLAKLYLEGIEERSAILRIVKATNFIGGPGIYLDQMHHFTITALIESTVCFIDMQVFKQIIEQNRAFAEEFMRDFSRNILSVYNRLIFLTQKQMPGRMADALLYLFDEIFDSPRFDMVLTKQDLADLSGMSKDSATKVLREFQNDGIIRMGDHEMELVNADALRTISRIG